VGQHPIDSSRSNSSSSSSSSSARPVDGEVDEEMHGCCGGEQLGWIHA
jgi:hypothetical protein